MGECTLCFRATWPEPLTEAQAEAINDFMHQLHGAYLYWIDRQQDTARSFWPEFKEKFPRVADMLAMAGLKGRMPRKLACSLDVNPMDESLADEGDRTIYHAAEVGHNGTWGHVGNYFKARLGAIGFEWLSEEDYGPGEVLDMQEATRVLAAILDRPDDALPQLMGIHPLLDAKIAEKLGR